MLFIVLTAVFVMVELVPSNPLALFVPPRCGPAACAAIRDRIIAQWGLDQPVPTRFGLFLANVLTGNLGLSLTSPVGTSVSTLIADALPATLAFLGVGLVLVAILALAIGFILSRRRGSIADAVVSLLLALPFAATPLLLGFLALYVLFFQWHIVSIPASATGFTLGDAAVIILIIVGSVAALFTWMVRDHPLRPLGALPPPGDWRPRENPQTAWLRRVLAMFFATLPPLLPWIIGAVLLSEVVWGIGGLGPLLYRSLIQFDVTVVMGILLALGLLVILPITLAADLLHEWLTSSWVRADRRSVEDLTVQTRDVPRGLRAVLNSASGFAGIALILLFVGMAFAAPFLVGPYPNGLMLVQADQPPSAAHLLGTDSFGRDELTLLLYGVQPAFPVALLAFAIALWAGVGLVALEGLLGAKADVFLSVPLDAGLILGSLAGGFLAFQILGPGFTLIPALVTWPITTRILLLEIRGLVRSPSRPWAPRRASRGNRALSLVWGTSPLILGNAVLSSAFALSLWATFGALGLGGVRFAAVAGWGELLGLAWNNLAIFRDEWWLFVPPSFAVLAAVLAPTLLGLSLKRIPLRKSGQPTPTAIPEPVPAAVTEDHLGAPRVPPPGGPASGP